jgi:hypothetical protein
MRHSAFGTLAFAGFLNFSGGVHQVKTVRSFEPAKAIKRRCVFISVFMCVLKKADTQDLYEYLVSENCHSRIVE